MVLTRWNSSSNNSVLTLTNGRPRSIVMSRALYLRRLKLILYFPGARHGVLPRDVSIDSSAVVGPLLRQNYVTSSSVLIVLR